MLEAPLQPKTLPGHYGIGCRSQDLPANLACLSSGALLTPTVGFIDALDSLTVAWGPIYKILGIRWTKLAVYVCLWPNCCCANGFGFDRS